MPAFASPNYGARRGEAQPSLVVLHYTGMVSAKAALNRLCDPESGVSAHVLIDEAGRVHDLVPEEARAWHAGLAHWRGIDDVNSHSIGIELANPGHDWGYRPFPEAQMASLEGRLADLMSAHGITPGGVLGHSDVAPTRKRDPGEAFAWPRLEAAGLAQPTPRVEPDARALDRRDCAGVRGFQGHLRAIGYGVLIDGRWGPMTAAVTAAFQRRRLPHAVTGQPCAQTLAVARALAT